MCTCRHTRVPVHMYCAGMCACMHVCMHAYACVYTSVCMYLCLHVYVCGPEHVRGPGTCTWLGGVDPEPPTLGLHVSCTTRDLCSLRLRSPLCSMGVLRVKSTRVTELPRGSDRTRVTPGAAPCADTVLLPRYRHREITRHQAATATLKEAPRPSGGVRFLLLPERPGFWGPLLGGRRGWCVRGGASPRE